MNEDLPIFPELCNSILDAETLGHLFRDIAACARVIEVIPKLAAREYVPQSSLTLFDAHSLFLAGRVRAIQVRYVFDGAQWWDTIMQTPAGIRLVRIRHNGLEASGETPFDAGGTD